MMLDIFKPDRGEVAVLGGEITEEKKNRIGYMPEERGLYQDIPLDRCLTYFGQLKGQRRRQDLIDHCFPRSSHPFHWGSYNFV